MTILPHAETMAPTQADHVSFSIEGSRLATLSRLRVSIGLIAFLGVAIGVCGAAIPPQSGWASEARARQAVVRPIDVNDWLQASSVHGD